MLTVSAVCEDVPTNSHLDFDMLISINTLPFIRDENFMSFSVYQYLMLYEKIGSGSWTQQGSWSFSGKTTGSYQYRTDRSACSRDEVVVGICFKKESETIKRGDIKK